MRRLGTKVAALLLAGAGLTLAVPGTLGTASAAGSPTAAAAGCTAGWGSLPKVSTETDYKPLRDIRTGRHACYDRMVLDVLGPDAHGPIGYRVGYVEAMHQDGSGDVVPVGGGAILDVRVAAPAYDPRTGQATYDGRARQPLPDVDLSGYRTFQDTRFGGSFEGVSQVALGVRGRLPFRVFQWGNHLVVDVAHSWRGFR
ncbi:AMIN-like domain-containing (lipo)protein [Streptomyces cinnamoneus]|uniref:AMIN-like domain-containing (lipo)protein n=1 Tax=Streptomyces cinnamoneus TaxID=53446 RepID=UPI0015E46C27|nr:hypothetical protein [Streptomyces cinnamoneus]